MTLPPTQAGHPPQLHMPSWGLSRFKCSTSTCIARASITIGIKGDLMFQVICHVGLGRVVRHDLHSIIIDGVPSYLPQDVVTRALICSAEHRPARGITHLQQIFESKGTKQ
jgi:hypothetical protein